MNKTKIEWWDWTWNPVWGCNTNCPYCYAKKMHKRFQNIIIRKEVNYRIYNNIEYESYFADNFEQFIPVFLYKNYPKRIPEKACRIFVNSMSDIWYWQKEWMDLVLKRIGAQPRQQFLFLTKNINTYNQYDFPNNCWKGISIDGSKEKIEQYWNVIRNTEMNTERFFISLEPLLENIQIDHFETKSVLQEADWIIIGAETGNRKGKVIPRQEWIQDIVKFCQEKNTPLFMKNSLMEIWDMDLIQEFPEGLQLKIKE